MRQVSGGVMSSVANPVLLSISHASPAVADARLHEAVANGMRDPAAQQKQSKSAFRSAQRPTQMQNVNGNTTSS